MNRLRKLFKFTACAVLAFASVYTSVVPAKSLYVIANINANPTPLRTYDIQPAPAYLVFQATANVPSLAGGAVGLALDESSEKLFVTYEGSNTMQLVDARTFTVLSTTTAPGATNLAGIVVDQGKSKVYTVDRNTNNLYVYSWVAATDTLTLDGGAPVALSNTAQAHGIALDEIRGRLYVGDANSMIVRYYDTSTFGASPVAEAGSIDLSAEGQTVQGIAIDSIRNILYTGNAWSGSGSVQKLVKYDIGSGAISSYTLPTSGDNIVGVAVDEDTGNVYTTTGNQAVGGTDTLIVFDSNLNILKNDIGDIGDPTGLVIPRANISFNPLNFSKTDDVDPVTSGDDLTYTLCYDNVGNVSAVNNVLITDDIPAGTTFVSATGPFSTTPTTVTWSVGTVAAGAAQVCYNMVVNVTAATGTTLLNAATIDSDETPPTTQTESTAVGGTVAGVFFTGDGDGGTGSTGPVELLLALLGLVLLAARRLGGSGERVLPGVLVGAVLVASMAAADSVSAEGKWYAGAGGGFANTDIKDNDYDSDLAKLGYTTSSSIDDTSGGWKLFGGYQFTPNWGVEAIYVDLGDVTSKTVVSSGPVGWTPQDFVDAAADVHPYSVDGIALAGTATWPVNDRFSVYAKLGAFAWQAEIKVKCKGCTPPAKEPSDQSDIDLMGGLGAGYEVTDRISVRAEWELYGTDRDNVDFYSASLIYHF